MRKTLWLVTVWEKNVSYMDSQQYKENIQIYRYR